MKSSLSAIFRRSSVLFAYQFGSTVNGHARHDSDVDIAVFLDPKLSPTERFDKRLVLMSDLEGILKKRVDLVVFNDLQSLFFTYVIVSEGCLIYTNREEAHLDFVSRAMGLYFDYQPFMELYNKHYVQKCAQAEKKSIKNNKPISTSSKISSWQL
ncbi:nucleotidyltransferase domain-containing protein [Candidatus Peregrinibacteria bacterium]|nr:nucleotidyltransferase domain-containing protein [Candidatus Peregrinibacteria bacterium]